MVLDMEILLRSHRALTALEVRAHRVDGGVPLFPAESAGFVRTMAHRVRQRRVVLAVCKEGEPESEKRASSDVLPVVPVVHCARDSNECCTYKRCEGYQRLRCVAALILQGKVRPRGDCEMTVWRDGRKDESCRRGKMRGTRGQRRILTRIQILEHWLRTGQVGVQLA